MLRVRSAGRVAGRPTAAGASSTISGSSRSGAARCVCGALTGSSASVLGPPSPLPPGAAAPAGTGPGPESTDDAGDDAAPAEAAPADDADPVRDVPAGPAVSAAIGVAIAGGTAGVAGGALALPSTTSSRGTSTTAVSPPYGRAAG